jgi:hypothetical protein
VQERVREAKEKEAALSMPAADKDGSFRYPGFADPAPHSLFHYHTMHSS